MFFEFRPNHKHRSEVEVVIGQHFEFREFILFLSSFNLNLSLSYHYFRELLDSATSCKMTPRASMPMERRTMLHRRRVTAMSSLVQKPRQRLTTGMGREGPRCRRQQFHLHLLHRQHFDGRLLLQLQMRRWSLSEVAGTI